RNSATSVTEVIPDTICNWYAPVAIDADGYPRVFWGQDGYTYESKRLPEGWEAPGNVSQGNGGAYQPDVATDANGNLHMVWYDLRDGNWEIYYSTNALDRIPVIFIPGLTGSRIYVPQSINWLQPDGHGGNYENPYKADEEIWINLLQLSTQHDDYFDILRMEKDGVTQSTGALYGVNLEARDIVGNAGLLDVYNNLLSDLQTVGYQSEIDLFTFPYDWRMDISHNAQLLNNRILEILEIANGTEEQSQWEITQVDLIAHSMGASVAREYISYPVQAARVRRLIAIGPVFLGAPKPLKSILFGDALVPALNPDEAKDIVQNMPGAFQVIPSNAYWEFYDGTPGNPVAFHENRDFDGDNQVLGDLSYNQFKSLLFGLDRDPNIRWDTHGKDINQTVFNIAKDFHSRLDSSWDTGIPVPEVNLIAGTGLCTIGQYQSTWRIKTGPVRIDPIIRVNEVNGDGTVPLFSASLYDAKRGIDHRGGANLYYVAREYANHPFLLAKEPIRQLVINLLQGDDSLPSGIISEADVPGKCLGTVINVESPVELHVTDAGGNHTGLTFSDTDGWAIETGILDSQYEEIEETKLIYLPYDGEYTIFLKATDDGSFNLIIHSYESNGDEKTIVYLRAPLTTTTTGEVVFDTSLTEPPLLRLDHDGDGITDEIIDATSIIDSTEGIDSQPPQIEIISPDQEQVLAGNILVEWQSSDNESGILNEWGYLDMGTPDEQPVSNGAVKMLPYGEHSITVLAEDHLGNATQKQVSFTVYSFEWLSPISGAGTYSAKAGSTIPVKFRVLDLNGVFVHDESVQLSMLDATGNVVIDPFVFAHNPTQGVAIQGNTQYHHNLRTKGLAAGTYTLRVVFNSPQMSGIIELPVILR
ncbi:MAG: lipase/acyltransferase domain-containing protein, partial [Chloroflexota bacterium]